MKEKTCCFIGHRTIQESDQLKLQLYAITEKLITDQKVDSFLFGSKSRFNDLYHEIVTKIKEKHPHIKRIYVRAEYPHISDRYKAYLLEDYEETYYPQKIIGSGRAAYVERNCEMIDHSRFCVIYYNEHTASKTRKSGTKIALDFAVKRGKEIIKLPKDL